MSERWGDSQRDRDALDRWLTTEHEDEETEIRCDHCQAVFETESDKVIHVRYWQDRGGFDPQDNPFGIGEVPETDADGGPYWIPFDGREDS
jgi:hypothetical protein